MITREYTLDLVLRRLGMQALSVFNPALMQHPPALLL